MGSAAAGNDLRSGPVACAISAVGNPEHGDGKDKRHGAGVEEAFDDVDGNLRTERKAGFLSDQVGADRVGHAANQRDSREADNLRSEQREERDFLVVAEQQRPAAARKT